MVTTHKKTAIKFTLREMRKGFRHFLIKKSMQKKTVMQKFREKTL